MNTKKNHEISLATAIEMTRRYRAHQPEGFARSESFSKEAIQKLINAKGCASLRIYYGRSENMEAHAILVAANAEGKDILPATMANSGSDEEEPIILEDAWRCPPLCPDEASPLNNG